MSAFGATHSLVHARKDNSYTILLHCRHCYSNYNTSAAAGKPLIFSIYLCVLVTTVAVMRPIFIAILYRSNLVNVYDETDSAEALVMSETELV